MSGFHVVSVDTEFELTHDRSKYVGVKIETNKEDILCLIESGNFCCEDYGTYISTDYELSTIIGKSITSIKLGKESNIREPKSDDRDCNGVVIRVETERGLIKLVAWNEHNGYYPHQILTKWEGYEEVHKV